jgi:hypothetical protein
MPLQLNSDFAHADVIDEIIGGGADTSAICFWSFDEAISVSIAF